jgi:hypothetical protein
MTLLSAVLADSINDVSSTRKVYLLAAALVLLGIVLIVVTVWFWRTSRHDPELLAPLEVMGTKRFRTLDAKAQQQLLDSTRPADAEPMRWGLVRGDIPPEPEIDLRQAAQRGSESYEDLFEPALDDASAASMVAVAAVLDVGESPAPAVGGSVEAAEAAVEVPVTESADESPGSPESKAGAPTGIDGTAPVAKPEPALLIVPLDHDLVAQRDELHVPAPAHPMNDHHPEVVEDESPPTKPAIDPLLRMFEGS